MPVKTPFHNEARDIAKVVLMPGDPLRAKLIAEEHLEYARCVNTVRGMLAYTGKFHGKDVTVMGSGMGVPSMGIYARELYEYYRVKTIIRIGSCGAYTPELGLRDIILVTASYYEGAYAIQLTGKENHFAYPDSGLNLRIEETAEDMKVRLVEGPIATVEACDPYLPDPLSIAKRYQQDPNLAKHFSNGLLGSEMESFGLFSTASECGGSAACLLTVADSGFRDEALTQEERQRNLTTMIEVALNTAARI